MSALKCLIWDLDDTLWSGVLAEGDRVALRPGVRELLAELDARGVLHSIASLGDREAALAQLEALGLAHFFLAPQIDAFADKPRQIHAIARSLDLGLGQLAFVDQSPHQRAWVAFALPEVQVLAADDLEKLAASPRIPAQGATPESARRRQLYVEREARRRAEDRFAGTRAEFLASCDLLARVGDAVSDDVPRVAELIARTHRFHASERRLDAAEVGACVESPVFQVRTARLVDRFGDHGLVGAGIVSCDGATWRARALVVSCRVQGLGIGDALLADAIERARRGGAGRLEVAYRATRSNLPMTLLLARHGFRRLARRGGSDWTPVGHDLKTPPALPGWLRVERS